MDYVTGAKKKEVLGIAEIKDGCYTGKIIKMNGAVHNIRHMGEVAFVVLRKAEGLVQCVWEQGVTDFDIHALKEESAVEVEGEAALEERAPQGFEIRLKSIRVLSEPAEQMPIPVNKWKLVKSFKVSIGKVGSPRGIRRVCGRVRWGYENLPIVYWSPGGNSFHSMLGSSTGTATSGGCMRCLTNDLMWIYNNIPDGTTVYSW